jgi:clan AA aspartic protease
MIHGVVNQSCEAILPIVVKNDARTQLVDAVIDTGFSGFLTLPSSTIESLDLIWKGRDIATLGDGTSCIFEVYIAVVIWDGQYRTIDINESETMPLIGMQLLRGYDLRIQAIEGGSVTIEALSLAEPRSKQVIE